MSAKLILAVGAGSFIGGALRYAVSVLMRTGAAPQFPWRTLAINVAGCLFMGFVFGFAERGRISRQWELFLATGVLGGFTTFSAFSIESVNLLKNKHPASAALYVGASVVFGLLATYFAYHRTIGK